MQREVFSSQLFSYSHDTEADVDDDDVGETNWLTGFLTILGNGRGQFYDYANDVKATIKHCWSIFAAVPWPL